VQSVVDVLMAMRQHGIALADQRAVVSQFTHLLLPSVFKNPILRFFSDLKKT